MLLWLSPGKGWDAVTSHRLGKAIKMAELLKIEEQVSSMWAKVCMLDDSVCVCYLTLHDYSSLRKSVANMDYGVTTLNTHTLLHAKNI